MFGKTTVPNHWQHTYFHHTTILFLSSYLFFLLAIAFEPCAKLFLGNIWPVLKVGWFRHFFMQMFGRNGQREWQGWLWDHGGWRRGRVSHWPWHHNKISDDQSRAVSAGGSRSACFTSLSHLIFLSAIIHCLSPRQRSIYVRTGWDLPDQKESVGLEGMQTVPEYLWESRTYERYRRGWKEFSKQVFSRI